MSDVAGMKRYSADAGATGKVELFFFLVECS